MLRQRFVAFAEYKTIPTNKKPRTVAGLIGSGDRSGVRVPVALDADGHMRDVRHGAVVEV